ncbi:hypothetical protein FBZ91_104256 [Nitrospirillum viridazoti]|nr:hypothetical protein FBZ91_104256 [Nitrospirillum amazonense]
MLSTIVSVIPQYGFVIPTAIENANNRHQVRFYAESDHHALSVIGDAQAGSHIVTHGAAIWMSTKAFTVTYDCFGILGRDVR